MMKCLKCGYSTDDTVLYNAHSCPVAPRAATPAPQPAKPMVPEDLQALAAEVGRAYGGHFMPFFALDRAGSLVTAIALHKRRPGKYPRTACAHRAAELTASVLQLVAAWGLEAEFSRHLGATLRSHEESAVKMLERREGNQGGNDVP